MFRKSPDSSGFTLVELLVVVAIIGILASIAIVNLLNAQTRAKVGRAKADISTIVKALEIYYVDNNAYPPYHYSGGDMTEFHIGGWATGVGQPDPSWDGRNPLTSPIAYMASMPWDPFASHRRGQPAEIREYLYVNWPCAIHIAGTGGWRDVFVLAYQNYGPYRIHSRGPDRDGPDSGMPYDPTNGITSDGDITYGPKTNFDRFIPFPR